MPGLLFQQILDLVRMGSCCLSLAGSGFVGWRLCPERPWRRPHIRACLALLVAAGDVLFCGTQITTALIDERVRSHSSDTHIWQTDALCRWLGPLVYFSGWFSLICCVSIAHYLWIGARSSSKAAGRLLCGYLVFGLVYAGSAAGLFSSWERYSLDDNGSCWIDLEPEKIVGWQGWSFLISVVVPIGLAMAVLAHSLCCDTQPLHPACVVRRRNRVMTRYLVVLVLVWAPTIVRHVYATYVRGGRDKTIYRAMLAAEQAMLPLQGFFNALVFKLSEKHRRRTEATGKGPRQVRFEPEAIRAGGSDGDEYRKEAQRLAEQARQELASRLLEHIDAMLPADRPGCLAARTLGALMARDHDELRRMLDEDLPALHRAIEWAVAGGSLAGSQSSLDTWDSADESEADGWLGASLLPVSQGYSAADREAAVMRAERCWPHRLTSEEGLSGSSAKRVLGEGLGSDASESPDSPPICPDDIV